MSTANVVNPGLVNVANQSDGPLSVDQPVTVSPSASSGPLVQAANLAPGRGLPTPPPTTPPMTAGLTVEGGTFSPETASVANVTLNNVAGQVYGNGTTITVFV